MQIDLLSCIEMFSLTMSIPTTYITLLIVPDIGCFTKHEIFSNKKGSNCTYTVSTLQSVWPDVGIKSCRNYFKRCPKIATAVWLKQWQFSKLHKKSPNSWATFERKFVTETFQKLPNLVTLITVNFFHARSMNLHVVGENYLIPIL